MSFEIKREVLESLSVESIEKMHNDNDLDFVIENGKLICIVN